MIRSVCAFALAASLFTLPPASAQENAPIVVRGERLEDSEAALRACLERKCTPAEDIAATLRHAENQFTSGRYKDARGTLLASVGRNKRHAKELPVPVSDLLRANARIAAHLGEGDAYRIGTVDVLAALKAGLDKDDPRVLVARVELGDSYAKIGKPIYAQQTYAAVADRAHDLNLPVVEGFAKLRIAVLFSTLAEDDASLYGARADKALDELVGNTNPQMQPFVMAAKVIRARLAARKGNNSQLEALLAEFRARGPQGKPVILYSPAIKLPDQSGRLQTGGSSTARLSTEDFDDQWVDIGFWIGADGHVNDVDILRESPKLEGRWVKPVMDAITARQYAPLKIESGDPGFYRVERYTYTAYWTRNTGSRIRERLPEPRIEMLDLTTDADNR